ncbi:hypothetical protein AN958_10983 [Leucoagaricus sp. SymC.cos]|nr:hypothetical protein AN958_10983 [Leucoagaricus sp. SymC.cos]
MVVFDVLMGSTAYHPSLSAAASTPDMTAPFELYVPQEVVELIIGFAAVDGWALPSLCLVSRRFLFEAQRYLYQRVEIITPAYWDGRPFEDIWKQDVKNGTRFLITLTQYNPSLASHTRYLSHRPEYEFRDRGYWDLINRSLRLMVNLKVLDFDTHDGCGIPRMRTLFWKCKFKLDEFYWRDGRFHDPKGDLAYFLSFQPQLKRLTLNHCDDLPSHLCPRLEKFTGHRREIECVLPGRSVTRLEWIATNHHWDRDRDKLFDNIAKELSQIVSLIYGGSHVQRPSIRNVLPFLSSLEILHLIGYHDEWEFERLKALPKLRVLIWSPAYSSRPFLPLERQKGLIPPLFEMIKTLHCVYCHFRDIQHGLQNYFHWTSANDGPLVVDPPRYIYDWPRGYGWSWALKTTP